MNDQAADALKHIADKLDIPVQQLWAGLIAYAPFTFYQWLAGLAIAVGVLVVFVPLCVRFYRQSLGRDHYERDFIAAFITGIVAFAAALSVIVHVGGSSTALAAKYAPEAWAAKYIVERIRR